MVTDNRVEGIVRRAFECAARLLTQHEHRARLG